MARKLSRASKLAIGAGAVAVALLAFDVGQEFLSGILPDGWVTTRQAPKPVGPTSFFVYETRFVISYDGETQTAVWRDVCGAYPSTASESEIRMSSGSPGKTSYGCANFYPAVARFSDGSMAMFDVDQDTGRLWRGYLSWKKQNPEATAPNIVSWIKKGGNHRPLRIYPNDAVSPTSGVAYGGTVYWLSHWRPGGPSRSIVTVHPGVAEPALSNAPYNELQRPFVLKDAYSVGLCACREPTSCSCPTTTTEALPHDLMAELNALRNRSARFGRLADAYDAHRQSQAGG